MSAKWALLPSALSGIVRSNRYLMAAFATCAAAISILAFLAGRSEPLPTDPPLIDLHAGDPAKIASDSPLQWQLTVSTQRFDDERRPVNAEGAFAFRWDGVEADDYSSYIANLRAIGMPELTIRRIVTAELHKQFDAQRQTLLATEPIPFWDAGFGAGESELPAYIAIERQERAEFESLLSVSGTDIELPSTDSSGSDLRLGGSLAPKASAILTTELHIAEQRDVIVSGASDRSLTPAEDAKLQQLNRGREAALSAILTPVEREDYEVRNSPAADAVRESLRENGTSVNEAEFRQLFRARLEYQHSVESAAQGRANLADAWTRYLSVTNRVLGPDRALTTP